MKHRTEQVHDEEMAPLVAQLIEIAKREGIPLLVSAGMLADDGEEMLCTTIIADAKDDCIAPGARNRFGLCVGIVRGHGGFNTASALAITRHHPAVPR